MDSDMERMLENFHRMKDGIEQQKRSAETFRKYAEDLRRIVTVNASARKDLTEDERAILSETQESADQMAGALHNDLSLSLPTNRDRLRIMTAAYCHMLTMVRRLAVKLKLPWPRSLDWVGRFDAKAALDLAMNTETGRKLKAGT